MKQLDRLLFVQGGECFFCKKPLRKADASVEHLLASANGGTNAEDNCVACCKTLNALLGSKSLKEKLEVFLRQKGAFRCPAETSVPQASSPAPRPVSGDTTN
jgi:5-methylcytosine-specific restriction endonuclease McrA